MKPTNDNHGYAWALDICRQLLPKSKPHIDQKGAEVRLWFDHAGYLHMLLMKDARWVRTAEELRTELQTLRGVEWQG